MNIQPITPPLRPGQQIQCCACHQMGATLADLDGPAFHAFYHARCLPAGAPTLYEALKAAGVPLDHHESDLYAKVTPESTRILEAYGRTVDGWNTQVFTSQIDGERWYDLPFKYDPFWEAISRRSAQP